MDKSEKSVLLVFLIILISACCLLVVCGGLALLLSSVSGLLAPTAEITDIPDAAPTSISPKNTSFPSPTLTPIAAETVAGMYSTLATLQNTVIPSADLIYLAERYEGKKGIPLQLTTYPIVYEVGDRLEFNKLNTDTNISSVVSAVLRYASDHLYFWVEDGVYIDREEMLATLDVFENQIYFLGMFINYIGFCHDPLSPSV